MRIFLIRHADPDYPNDTITPLGHQQAAALAQRFKSLGLDALYCSPLGRAQATAQHISKALNLQPTTLDWLTERGHWRITQNVNGNQDPWCAWDVHAHLVRPLQPPITTDNWHTYPLFSNPLFLSEFTQIQSASDALFASHGYQRHQSLYHATAPLANRQKIALVCHGGLGLIWLAHILQLPLPLVWASFFLPPTSVTTILMDHRPDTSISPHIATPRCIGMGDISHLYAANIPFPTSGIKANTE